MNLELISVLQQNYFHGYISPIIFAFNQSLYLFVMFRYKCKENISFPFYYCTVYTKLGFIVNNVTLNKYIFLRKICFLFAIKVGFNDWYQLCSLFYLIIKLRSTKCRLNNNENQNLSMKTFEENANEKVVYVKTAYLAKTNLQKITRVQELHQILITR